MEHISLRDYHRLAQRTSQKDGHDKVDNGVLGLIGETGELVDLYKKWVYQSTPGTKFPYDAAMNELGDVMWYLEELADGMGTSMNMVTPMTFSGLDQMTEGVKPLPTLRAVITGLSSHANAIRKAVDMNDRDAVCENMRRALNTGAWLARLAGVPMEQVAIMNIEKLKKRYPEGFDAKISMARSAKEYTDHS